MLTDIIETISDYGRTHPDWVAYDELGQTHTYGELLAASDGIATTLGQLKLTPKAPVMVYADQSFATVATFLGCVKAGHAYIPVDIHSPNDRLTMIADIAQPALTIAVQPLPISLPGRVLGGRALEAAMTAPRQPQTPVVGDENFYIIFTSGTTGQPKGVQISHTNLLSFVNWFATFQLPARPRVLAQAPYSFDLSVMTLYPTLTAGGVVKVLPTATTANLKSLFAALPKLDLQVWVSTPSFMDICLLDPTFDAAHYPALQQIYFCGEELTRQTAATLLDRFPEVALFNTYGPTEATVAVTAVQITLAVLEEYPRLPIGKIKPDTTISLRPGTTRQEDMRLTGELLLAGPSVAKGYLNRPDKTAAVFSDTPAGRAYATGDLGTIDADGMVHYRGRTDFQIKLNGYRIELEEVNHYLNAEPLIKQAVAVPKYNAAHKVSQLLAYVVPAANDYDSEFALTKALRQALGQTMMSYMVPQRFIYRDALPLTQNGKVAIKQLISEVNAS